MTYRLGVDVGGTFTDVVLYDSGDQRVWLAKTPSTPGDQSVGVIEGIRLAADRASVPLPDLDAILHGTTVATNAVLERRGALVGLIVTQGFRHILHLAEAWTPGPLFGFMVYEKPEPLTDTRYVREVPERTGADGAIVEPIDAAAVRAAVEELVADGVEALTVCLLNAHANGRHERVVARDRRLRRSRPAGLDLVRDPPRVPRVRAHRDDADERVRRTGPREVPDERPRRSRSRARAGADPGRALGRRPDEPRVGVQEPGADGAVGAGRRRQRGIVRRVARGLRPHPHVRHGRDVHGRRRLRVGTPRDHARDERRRLSRARACGRRREHRRRRRLDRVRRGGDGSASGRPGERRAPFPALPATAAAARPRRSRTPTSSSATCRRACSAASSSSTRRRRTRRSRGSPRPAAPASRRPRERS